MKSNKEIVAIYSDLLGLMSEESCHKRYRNMLHSIHPPCIPYLGTSTQISIKSQKKKNKEEQKNRHSHTHYHTLQLYILHMLCLKANG